MAASSTPPVSGMSSTSATMRAGPRRFPLLLLAAAVVISITFIVILSAPVAAGSARKLRQAIGHTAVEAALGVVAILIGFAHRHAGQQPQDRKSTRLNSSHVAISYAVFRLTKNKWQPQHCRND